MRTASAELTGSSATASALDAIADRVVGTPGPFSVPGLVALIERDGEPSVRFVRGTDAAGTPLRHDTLFPLASTSKLPVGLLVLHLVDDGVVGLDVPIARYVPGSAGANPTVTVRKLLAHTSGLPLDLPVDVLPYRPGLDWPALRRACVATPLQYEPGTIAQYSNVGYGLLAAMAEHVTGEPFWPLMRRTVLEPLGVDVHPAHELPRAAAVLGDIRSAHTGTPFEPVNGAYWRSLAVPWAGLFGTADGLLALARAYGTATHIVGAELLAEARRDQNPGIGGGFTTTDPVFGFAGSGSIRWPHCAWGLCVEVRGAKHPHWTPPATSHDSYGHLGSSGCLAWCDPGSGSAWAIVGPRTTDSGWLLRYGTQIGALALRPRDS